MDQGEITRAIFARGWDVIRLVVYTGLRGDQGKALFAVGPLVLAQTIRADRQASSRLQRMEFATGYFQYPQPKVAIRCIARQCKLQ